MFKYLPGVCATLLVAASAQAQESMDVVVGGAVTEVGNMSLVSSEAEAATGSLDIVERMSEVDGRSFFYDVHNNTNGALIGFGVSNNYSFPVLYEESDTEETDSDYASFERSIVMDGSACTKVDGNYETCYTTRRLTSRNWGDEFVVDPRAYLPPLSDFFPEEYMVMNLNGPTLDATFESTPTESGFNDLMEFEPQTFEEVFGSFESVAGDDNTINWFDFFPKWSGSIYGSVQMFEQDPECLVPFNDGHPQLSDEDFNGRPIFECFKRPVMPNPIAELMNAPLLAGDELNGFFGFQASLPASNVIGAIGTSTGVSYVSANPAPVPLPAAGWMLIAGIGGMVAAGRRKRG